MSKHPRTHASIHILWIFLLFAASALAQNGNIKSNLAPAVLNVRVNVVQTVALPPARQTAPVNNAVTWNFSTAKPDVEVREEIRPLFGSSVGQSGNGEGAVLKTLTIVPR